MSETKTSWTTIWFIAWCMAIGIYVQTMHQENRLKKQIYQMEQEAVKVGSGKWEVGKRG